MVKVIDSYAKATTIQKRYQVSPSTLRRWDKEGKIRTVRTPGGYRMYHTQDVDSLFEQPSITSIEKKKVCYARVSSQHQKGDLERQIKDLQSKCPTHEIVKDIGSGLNYDRKGFKALLERVYDGVISEVVIAHKDRLCRYGFELVEFIFKKAGAKIVVLGSGETPDPNRELADDLLTIVNYFVAKRNGLRSGENKRKRAREEAKKEAKKDEEERRSKNRRDERTSSESEEDQTISQSEPEEDSQ
jgi:putative resolvase